MKRDVTYIKQECDIQELQKKKNAKCLLILYQQYNGHISEYQPGNFGTRHDHQELKRQIHGRDMV